MCCQHSPGINDNLRNVSVPASAVSWSWSAQSFRPSTFRYRNCDKLANGTEVTMTWTSNRMESLVRPCRLPSAVKNRMSVRYVSSRVLRSLRLLNWAKSALSVAWHPLSNFSSLTLAAPLQNLNLKVPESHSDKSTSFGSWLIASRLAGCSTFNSPTDVRHRRDDSQTRLSTGGNACPNWMCFSCCVGRFCKHSL